MSKREIVTKLVLTDYQPNTNIAAHVEKVIGEHKLPMLTTRINRLVAFKEMTFTGDVPTTGVSRHGTSLSAKRRRSKSTHK